MPRRSFLLLGCSLLLLTASGCVERWLMLRSDPPGARAFVDGTEVGTTPVRVSFDHYGTREVYLRAEDHGSLAENVEIAAPWYQYFPFDLVAEYLWPFTIADEHELDFALPPLDTDQIEEELEAVVREHQADPEAPTPGSSQPGSSSPSQDGPSGNE